jgi:hypothetical protein
VAYGPGFRRRRRGRTKAVVITALIVVIALVSTFVGLHVRDDRNAARARSQTDAVRTADAFLTAWGRGDAAGMASYATPDTAAYVRSEIPTLATSLQISSQKYTATAVTSRGLPGATFHADVVLQGLGTWSYDGKLAFRKVAGRWRVAFDSVSVYPGLGSGDRLVRTRQLGPRAQLVLADGQPIRGRDAELTGNLIGTVVTATAAQAKTAGPLFIAGDKVGLGGLERTYNATLAGTPGGSLTIQDINGGIKQTLINLPGVAGQNVPLSLDLGVQRAAENALTGIGALTGSIVAIDVTTGKVLALANHPTNGFGRAILGTYPPGSTFKIITTTAALMAGKTAATPLACTPNVVIGGRTFVNAEGESYGTISLEQAFAKSCNTAFINLSQQLPQTSIGQAAALFGFSSKQLSQINAATDGPLPVTSFGGSAPPPIDATDVAAEAIGQGRIVASPLQMASVAAAVASGTWRQPYVSATPPAQNPTHVLPAGVVPVLQQFMADVVATGTAKGSGLPAGTHGKTGTAEYGTSTPLSTIAWFVGWRGNIAFACQAGGDGTNGGFGATTAAPACARFLRNLG